MRRIVTALMSLSLAFSFLLAVAQPAQANDLAGGGFSSSYAGESVFTNKAAGESGQFSAIFFNDGSQSWSAGVVGLLVCLADKTTCNVASPNAAYASGWTSTKVYATVSATTAPGQNGFFIYNFTVPAGTAPGTAAVFNGDVGLIATGAELRPEGYFQTNTTPAAAGALTLSPASAALPVGGQQQFTATGAPTGTTVSWTVNGGCGAVTNTGLFAATAVNSVTQPCSVVATAGGLTATAPITVFGPVTKIICAASKSTIVADGGNTSTTVTGTLQDASGNVVSNDNSTVVTFTNNTPTILSTSSSTPDQTATAGSRIAVNGVASKVFLSTSTAGTGVVSLASGTLTGCTQNITTTAPGAAAQLSAAVGLKTITADPTSTAVIEVDVQDASGALVVTDSSTSITVSRDTGASVCNIGGGGSGGPTTVSSGSAFFTVTATSTPGTCSWTATANVTGVSTSSATLTTVLSGAPNKLAVTNNNSPKPADGVSTMRVTVALRDANDNPITTPASQTTVTATLGNGCNGTNAAGETDTVKFISISSGVTTVVSTTSTTKATGALTFSTILAGTSNLVRFTLSSSFATAGCTITFTAANSAVSSTTSTVVFTAGGVAGVACVFSPKRIAADGSSTSTGIVSMVDTKNNLSTAGSFSVSFAKTSGDNVTTLLTTGTQTTSSGQANFSVQSKTTATTTPSTDIGTDTYTATATINGVATATTGKGAASTCTITTEVPPITP